MFTVKGLYEVGTIESTLLGFEDHGIFIAQICFDLGGSGQCIQACLDPSTTDGFIKRILWAVDVNTWEELVGKQARIYRDEPYQKIVAISSINGTNYYRWGTK